MGGRTLVYLAVMLYNICLLGIATYYVITTSNPWWFLIVAFLSMSTKGDSTELPGEQKGEIIQEVVERLKNNYFL